ncbi:hypothetical protein ZIOFF_018681 [Zingiber officinale]|uniref:1,3-beta-glucan synthase n=1 Tax=Zingiber officinale TaxID=94328 RepID=A0A8J5HGQ4_ZINOF|nr:hypothetical protein ZIOFF_018681 [Zingiber officinale]
MSPMRKDQTTHGSAMKIDDLSAKEVAKDSKSESISSSFLLLVLRLGMADEIVPAEGPSYRPPRIRSRSLADYAPEPFDSEKIPPTLVSEVRRFLRVANQIEAESPRVAYICRFHAFEKAHNLDPKSSGRGVRQFKTALLQRLEQDEKITKFLRKEKSDARELRSFYKTKNMKAGEVSSVLHEVLKAVVSGAGPEFVAAIDIDEKIGSYAPYNILPIDPGSGQQSIMHLPEIEAAVSAVLNVRGLPIAKDSQEMGVSRDILEWLQCWFGFQKGNVANQREHLILLLANIHGRLSPKPTSMLKLDDRAVHELMLKIFENYRKWCKFLGRRSNILLPSVKQEIQQYKLLYIALYLLIWGEAANLRLMPECLCYIFHMARCSIHPCSIFMMAYDLYGVLSGAIDLNTGEKAIPAYGGEHESFLSNVVTPIYKVIYEEAKNSKNGNADHSTWRNYDDLNEFFWSVDCFKIGWPMRLDNDFFYTPPHFSSQNTAEEMPTTFSTQKWVGKTNFVEIRSFWHLFRSFDRMWTFLVLALQVMIIMAWHDLETPLELLDPSIFEDILSIFVTNAVLRLMQVTLDIAFTWKARHTLGFYQKLRFALKFCICGIWTITLPTAYSTSQRNSVCSTKLSQSNLYLFCLSPYMIVVAIYLISNVLGMTLFFFPAVITYIEISNWRICKFLSWWAQPRLYVGRGMQEGQVSLLKYTIFWSILLFSKFLFSYHFEIKPLVQPTKQIMKVSVNNYDWHELFPKAKSNAGAILAVWTPVLLVYFMDTQIWYSIFCTIFGGVYGIVHHLGEIRTMGMVRSRFHLLPSRFNAFFVPHSSQSQKEDKGSFRKFLQNKIFKDLKLVKADIPRFSFVWNQIVTSFRSEDLISNRDMDLMIMPLSSNLTSQSIRWPLFLLTSKFSTAVNMTKEFVGEYEQLHWKINKDRYMVSAIKECYNSLKTIFKFLLVGDLEKRVLETIFDEIESSLKTSRLLVDFQMNELPVLHDKFIHLVELLFNNKPDDREKVVIILQDIVDILTKDMMVNCSRILDMINCSENDVSDGNIFLQDHPPELFASNFPMCAICFPLPDNGALKEQVKRIYLLLTVKEKAMDIPTNLEARRRISFFATSLFMDMPCAPKVRNMLSFSAMTPYYLEEIKFSHEELHSSQDGASILSYMQRIYPDEWENFLERLGPNVSDEEIRYWASFRGQTLSRTVRGMMYYRKALKLQAFLDRADDQDIYKRHTTFDGEQNKRTNQQSLSTQLGALADLKFTYVVSCQNFGTQKSRGDPHAQDIIDLMMRYSSLRVAYIEEKEDILADKAQKIYSSVLVKADNNLDQFDCTLCAMTPYYLEEIKFSHEELHSSQDGASILSYMQRIYPDEWENFLERLGPNVSDEEIRYWASFRGQTLSRTVRGMMYYRKALKLQAFLDRADDQDIYKRHTTFDGEQNKRTNQHVVTQLGALADLKFTYVVSCQNFGAQKSRGDPHAQDIIDLMMRYSSLRVAYIEEKEDILADKAQKIYSSVLVKADNNLDQEIYRIKLPGPPIIGEGKPENQNHAIIFTRGEALQTIDMNQDNYLEEAYKIRNVLQEFLRRRGKHPPTIVGLREHIFTGSVSSLAGFMSYQETSFVTIGQRFLANPLRVRFHYGHPDLFDRLFHLTRGGVSKASKTINLSEDVFAGFNSTLRRGYITYKEYMQVGKGRDVGLNQISKFEAKVANGNSEQSLSRDIYRLGRRFDFFRMLSCYFTTVGFYFNSLISIFGLYVFLYGQLYLVLSGLEKALITEARVRNVKSLETALASQSFLQLGLLTGLPMVVELGLEKGIRVALSDFILMQLQLASIFFTFSLGTKAHFFGRTILHGGAKYRPTGRKFVVFHASFSENYQLYSRSHFVKGFELICLLTVYNLFRKSYQSTMAYFMITYSSWFMAGTWLFTPFLFNPSGFAWRKIVEDWMDWNKWMKNQGGIGIKPNKCWESWWNAEYSHLKHSGWTSSIMEILISLRFFIYQYGLVYHLDISQDNKTILVYVLSWFVIVVVFSLVKLVDVGRSQLSAKHHLFFRLFKMLLFLSVISCIIILSTINQLSFMDLFVCCLAFIPTGWGLLLISHVFRSKLEYSGLWNIIQVVAYAYDYAMGCLLFAPIAALAWMPVISAIQTRVLFNQAFNRQLHIMPILAGKSKHR